MGAYFESTIWTTILKAVKEESTAIRELVDKYRPPIVSYIQRQGFSEHDAEDIAQEVFLQIFKSDVLTRVDQTRGRFRDLLLAVTKNMIRKDLRRRATLKRGGQDLTVSIDADPETSLENLLGTRQHDEDFDRLWIFNIMQLAFNRLKHESRTRGVPYYDALKLYLDDNDYKTIAGRLGKSEQDIKNYIHRARLKLAKYIREEIAAYSSSHEEYRDELRYIERFTRRYTEA